MKTSLILLDNFMGKTPCSAIFGKYIAPGGPLYHQAVIGGEDANSP